MSSAGGSIEEDSHYSHRHSCCGMGRGGSRGNWSGVNIAAMVIGFVLFWPIGLVILYWNITGRNLKDLPKAAQKKWSSVFNATKSHENSNGENSVFDEFQQTQYDRISELKEEIKSRAKHFKIFKSDAKRRADEAEFKDFMSSDRSQKDDN
ncbi:MAG: DUF2852 domain-containing protein [Cocleimonas sp.]|nr:DUF2852 domain-containing protein [Cocleimonas sp.]